MTHGRRIGVTAALFAAALVCVALASTTHSVTPVFVAWIPLLLVPWWLTRPVAGDVPAVPAADAGDDADGSDAAPMDAGNDAGESTSPGSTSSGGTGEPR